MIAHLEGLKGKQTKHAEADPNQISAMGETPLDVAAMEGNVAGMELLLKHGARVDLTNEGCETALFKAARYCQVRGSELASLSASGGACGEAA